MFKRYNNEDGSLLPMWQQVYNMLDSKIARLSQIAYEQANEDYPNKPRRKQHRPYTIPAEAQIMVEMLGELGPDTGQERCEEMASFATQYGITYAITKG